MHPFLQNRKVLDCCRTHGVAVTAYMPLAQGRVARRSGAHAGSASRMARAPNQVSLAWLNRLGVIVDSRLAQPRAHAVELRRCEAPPLRCGHGGDRAARPRRAHHRPGGRAGMGLRSASTRERHRWWHGPIAELIRPMIGAPCRSADRPQPRAPDRRPPDRRSSLRRRQSAPPSLPRSRGRSKFPRRCGRSRHRRRRCRGSPR